MLGNCFIPEPQPPLRSKPRAGTAGQLRGKQALSPTQSPRPPSGWRSPEDGDRAPPSPASAPAAPPRVAAARAAGILPSRTRPARGGRRAREAPRRQSLRPRASPSPGPGGTRDPWRTHPQHSRHGYLWPGPSGSPPAAKRKHVGPPNCGRGPSSRPPLANACRQLSQFTRLRCARSAQAHTDSACVNPRKARPRRATRDLPKRRLCVMTSATREAESPYVATPSVRSFRVAELQRCPG